MHFLDNEQMSLSSIGKLFADRVTVAQEIWTQRICRESCNYWIMKLPSMRIQKLT